MILPDDPAVEFCSSKSDGSQFNFDAESVAAVREIDHISNQPLRAVRVHIVRNLLVQSIQQRHQIHADEVMLSRLLLAGESRPLDVAPDVVGVSWNQGCLSLDC